MIKSKLYRLISKYISRITICKLSYICTYVYFYLQKKYLFKTVKISALSANDIFLEMLLAHLKVHETAIKLRDGSDEPVVSHAANRNIGCVHRKRIWIYLNGKICVCERKKKEIKHGKSAIVSRSDNINTRENGRSDSIFLYSSNNKNTRLYFLWEASI